jgi:integrase
MSENIKKRNGSWGYAFAYRDDSGQRRWARRYDKSWKQKDAQKAFFEARARVEAGHSLGTSKGTVSDYLLSWHDAYKVSGHVKPTQISTTECHLNAYLIPAIGGLQMKDLKPARIKTLYANLLKSGGTGAKRTTAGKPLSPKTVRNIAGTLHTALRDAVRMGVIATNPCDNIDLPKWERPEMKVWDDSQFGTFLMYCFANDDPMFAIWLLMFATGLRRGEVSGLRWDDVDFLDSSIKIRQTRVVAGLEVVTVSPKSTKSIRHLQIDSGTLDALARMKDAQEASAGLLGASCFPLVATDADGKVINPRTLSRRFTVSAERCGLPAIRLHDIRHTHASTLISVGTSLAVVSHRLGHSRISTTLDTYTHMMPTEDRDASNRFGLTMENAMKNASERR